MSGRALSARTAGKAGVAVAMSVLAIAAAPLVMGPTYRVLQPRAGSMTVVLVEVLYALFIDFPLTALYVGVLTGWQGSRRHPARSALAFSGTFFAMILLCIALAPRNDLLAYWALADTFPVAVAEVRSALGSPMPSLAAARPDAAAERDSERRRRRPGGPRPSSSEPKCCPRSCHHDRHIGTASDLNSRTATFRAFGGTKMTIRPSRPARPGATSHPTGAGPPPSTRRRPAPRRNVPTKAAGSAW